MSRTTFVRQPIDVVTARYDRMARWYRAAEITLPLMHVQRRRAVARLGLKQGDTALEIGCGTGRNLPLLSRAVGSNGHVIGLDASSGMLAQAQRSISRQGLANVTLMQQDAAQLAIEKPADAVLFSFSYSVLPDRGTTLARAWSVLRPDGRLVIVDGHIPDSLLGPLLVPIGDAIATVFPGDPYSRPWQDVRSISDATARTERFLFGIYSITTLERRPAARAEP
jgi:ubiquinone/menaquinone biosynthesis C-methylase UbiE